MSIRDAILAETIARLEAERYQAPVRPEPLTRHTQGPAELTPEQQAHNRQVLLDALSDDPVVIAFREREAAA